MRLLETKEAITEHEREWRHDTADAPSIRVLKATEVKDILINPDDVAKRIYIKERLEKLRNPIRQIAHGKQVNANYCHDLYEILHIANIATDSREHECHP